MTSADASDQHRQELRSLVADLTSAYLANNVVRPEELSTVILSIAGGLRTCDGASAPAEGAASAIKAATPAQVRRSITQDALISFEDGQAYRTLARHLSARGLTPDDYRRKWGLPRDYPMVAPSYSETRSALAKRMGLAEHGVKARKRSGARGQA